MILHSLLLLLHISVLDIAINSKNVTLLALVVLVQFAEVKAAAMKSHDICNYSYSPRKWTRKQLFDMCCDDVSERFSLAIYVVVLFILNFTKFLEQP